jgi:hypothetical protein
VRIIFIMFAMNFVCNPTSAGELKATYLKIGQTAKHCFSKGISMTLPGGLNKYGYPNIYTLSEEKIKKVYDEKKWSLELEDGYIASDFQTMTYFTAGFVRDVYKIPRTGIFNEQKLYVREAIAEMGQPEDFAAHAKQFFVNEDGIAFIVTHDLFSTVVEMCVLS